MSNEQKEMNNQKKQKEQFSDAYGAGYSEKFAIEACLDNMHNELEKPDATITITVNGVSHQFLLGGPQVLGLEELFHTIADENLYQLDETTEDTEDIKDEQPLTEADTVALEEAVDFVKASGKVVFGAASSLEEQDAIIDELKAALWIIGE